MSLFVPIIILLVILLVGLLIGLPLLVYSLFKSAAKAKEQGDLGRTWFIIWVIGMMTITIVIVSTLVGILIIFDS